MAKYSYLKLHLEVSGKVQGVGYRAAAVKTAIELQLNGWAKNTTRGTVEIQAEGHPEAIDKFLKWCAVGPSFAAVEKVVVLKEDQTSTPQFTKFEILR